MANVTSIYLEEFCGWKDPSQLQFALNCQPACRIIQGLRFFVCQPCNLPDSRCWSCRGSSLHPFWLLFTVRHAGSAGCLPFFWGFHPRWWLRDFCSPSRATLSWAIRSYKTTAARKGLSCSLMKGKFILFFKLTRFCKAHWYYQYGTSKATCGFHKLGGGFQYLLFLPATFGEMIQFDKYYSNGSKAPTRTRSWLLAKNSVWEDHMWHPGFCGFPTSTPSNKATFGNSDRFPVFQALKADMLSLAPRQLG